MKVVFDLTSSLSFSLLKHLLFQFTITIKQGKHQLSNIRHRLMFAKALTEQDQILCLMACIRPMAEWVSDILGEGSK